MKVLKKRNDPEKPVEMERMVMDFTMDCIARTVFSIDLNTPENPDNEFTKHGINFLQSWRLMLGMMVPGLCEWLHIPLFNPKSANYFENVRKNIRYSTTYEQLKAGSLKTSLCIEFNHRSFVFTTYVYSCQIYWDDVS